MKLLINGIVQGVGFRPFIHKLVTEYGLYGWVRNSTDGVAIELEGSEETLTSFLQDVEKKKPKLALIERMEWNFEEELAGYNKFEIVKSAGNEERFTLISPDVCTCDDCLNELFNKNNRRYRFPFINCTNCGPRFTIIKDIPYDRDKTTMNSFPMCSECNEEYCNIEDRRYHAQPDCCYDCGPELAFCDSEGNFLDGDPIENAVKYIKSGKLLH
jgi:hydrogenase maturation protein HypF